MNPRLVIDASVAVKWHLSDEAPFEHAVAAIIVDAMLNDRLTCLRRHRLRSK